MVAVVVWEGSAAGGQVILDSVPSGAYDARNDLVAHGNMAALRECIPSAINTAEPRSD